MLHLRAAGCGRRYRVVDVVGFLELLGGNQYHPGSPVDFRAVTIFAMEAAEVVGCPGRTEVKVSGPFVWARMS